MKNLNQALSLCPLFLCVYTCSYSQVVSSIRNGLWNDPATWSSGIAPSSLTSSEVIVLHDVVIPPAYEAIPPALRIDGSLEVNSGGKLVLSNAVLTINGSWVVGGTFVFQNGSSISGASASNTTFDDGSVFEFAKTTISELPLVNWFPSSTLLINNLQGNNSVTHHSWIQNFGHVVYNCPEQGSFMDFNGRLRSIQGDLLIRNTNRNILRLARGHILHLSVGGNLIVEGPSEVWFGESGEGCTTTIGGSFEFRSTSTTSSYLTLSGSIVLSIGRNFVLNVAHKLKCTSSTGKSAVINLSGNLNLQSGTIDALGTGRATFIFNGNVPQTYTRNSSALIEGHFNFLVEPGCELNLGESLLSNTLSGSLTVNGKLRVGSTHPKGAIQDSTAGNVFVRDGIYFLPGSILEYDGQSKQYINNHPAGSGTTTLINNSAGVKCLKSFQAGNLVLEKGNVESSYPISVANNFMITGMAIPTVSKFILNGISQLVDAKDLYLNDIDITGEGPVTLVSGLRLKGRLTITRPGTWLSSNGHLTIESTSDDSSLNGSIGSLPTAAGISGDVRVRRFMPAGRQYRYIAMPVKDVSVRQLQNSFPVTGTFADPSTGTGIISTSPSLFHYDESSESWLPYPVTGTAASNLLTTGKGYAAFIRNALTPVTWEVNGELLQGEINLPVTWDNTDTHGWNLVGNPYASSIDWDVPGGWVKNNISESIAVRDNREGRFRIWNGSVGDLEDGHIASGQAFWVQSTGSLPVVQVNESAKVLSDGLYYRERSRPAFLQITLKTIAGYDHAYFQLSEEAMPGVDRYDMRKRRNDLVNLSIVDSTGGHLAIMVTNQVPCTYEIPLLIEVPAGVSEAVISWAGFEEFDHASYILYNRKTGVMSDPDRKEHTIKLSGKSTTDYVLMVETVNPVIPKIHYDEWICAGQDARIEVEPMIPGLSYNLYAVLSDGEQFLGKGTSFVIPYDSLQGENEFHLYATSVCGSEIATMKIFKTLVEKPHVLPGQHCGPGPVVLHAVPMDSFTTFFWFKNETDTVQLSEGLTYLTPVLNREKTFYASAYDSVTGCESERIAVSARITEIPEVNVFTQGDTLVVIPGDSTYWFYNKSGLENNKPYYVPKKPGLYKVITYKNGCSSSDSIYFYPAAGGKKRFSTFPNPATEIVSFPVSDEDHVILTDIIDSNGKSVFYLCTIDCDTDYCHIKVGNLSRGVYFLIFRLKHDIEVLRIFLIN